MKKYFLAAIFILALTIRIFFSIGEAYGDINNYHIPWSNDVLKYGFSGFYDRNIKPGTAIYPPLAIYLFTISNLFSKTYNKPIMDGLWKLNITYPIFPSKIFSILNERQILLASMKMPAIFADMAMAVGIYFIALKLIKNKKSKLPFLFFVSILFNPALIFNSAIWGQIDIIPFAFFIWAIYFLIRKRFSISSLLLLLSMLSKQTIIFILPIYAVLFIKQAGWKNVIKSSLLGLLVFFIFFLPFFQSGRLWLFPYSTYLKIATLFGGDSMTAHAFNFWWLTGFEQTKDTFYIFGNITMGLLIQIIIIVEIVFLLILLIKKKSELKYSFLCMTILSLFIFLFSTRMHERHLLPAIPLLILLSIIDWRVYFIFLFTSLFHLYNLYASWKFPKVSWIIAAVENKYLNNFLIIIQIGLFIILYFWYLKENKDKKVIKILK
jgi:Gpi18-like mannosyltransferase